MSMGADLGQYILQTQFKKILKIQWRGEFEGGGSKPPGVPSLGTPGGLPKDTIRVYSRLKLTFGQLVSKSSRVTS